MSQDPIVHSEKEQTALKHALIIPHCVDTDAFASGETYFDRLFSTVHLWEETLQELRQYPRKKANILIRYDQKVRQFLQQSQ